jgi:hypothetical protein
MESRGTLHDHNRYQHITDAVSGLHNALDLPQEELVTVEIILSSLVSRIEQDIASRIEVTSPVYQGKNARIREQGGEELRIILLQQLNYEKIL